MTHAMEMLETMPGAPAIDREVLVRCIDACFDCAQACTSCAAACLEEASVAELRACIQLNLDCAAVCDATGTVLSRQAAPSHAFLRSLTEACAEACSACGEECESHAGMHEHCRVCADACAACESACRALLAAL